MYPQARREGILLQELDGEIIAYNTTSEQIFLLNPTTALVFEHLDGTTNPEVLTSVMVERLGLPADPALVALALQELRQAGLLEETEELQQPTVTRREVIKRLSLTGALLAMMPVVQSVVVPTPAMAASVGGRTCVGQGASCDDPSVICCPPLVCTNTQFGPTCSPPGRPDVL